MGWLCFHNCYFCLDEDECQDEKHNCHANAQCNNTFGSYNCTCLNGYSGDGVSCLGTYHSLKRVLSREYKATQPCVVFWVIKDFLSTGWKREGCYWKHTVIRATFVKVLRYLLHISHVATRRSIRENSLVWSLIAEEVFFFNWTVFATERVHFTLITTCILNASSVFFFSPSYFLVSFRYRRMYYKCAQLRPIGCL